MLQEAGFFPRLDVFFTLTSIDQKEIFTGLFSFFTRIYFFISLWECYLEDKSSLGNGRGKTVSVLLLTVCTICFYIRRYFLTIYALPQPFFLYPHGIKIRDLTRGCPACSYSDMVVVCSVWHGSLQLVGRPNSVCLALPSPDLCQG